MMQKRKGGKNLKIHLLSFPLKRTENKKVAQYKEAARVLTLHQYLWGRTVLQRSFPLFSRITKKGGKIVDLYNTTLSLLFPLMEINLGENSFLIIFSPFHQTYGKRKGEKKAKYKSVDAHFPFPARDTT